MVTYGNAPGYHQGGNLSESSERIMEVLFSNVFMGSCLPSMISSQLRTYKAPGARDFVKGNKLANYSSRMSTGLLDRSSFSRIPNRKIQMQTLESSVSL